ncbi:DNA utilization protein GntX [Fusobacterium necrogenes]|uniref:DNA utilization protein GntX n=1 Tax=Fusobacterium necrogenes TaxID=858 RepID=A0A377GYL0_9FUSO|nr:phosphoribosyltransferase family protein [Fusobacterium necrogenes]STO32015.1 DNA utilization protein GntX [Fusobacterium necrogenes]
MKKRNFVQNIKELVFSQRCPICKKISQENNYICNECYFLLKRKGKIKNIKNYYYLYYYNEEIKSLIADFKLKNRRNLGYEIALLIKDPIKSLIKEKRIDIVLPVPISKERERERGFNQIEDLLDRCGIEYKRIIREKNTKHMYELLDSKDRKKNIYNAFKNRNLDINGKNVLIVDDIVTTGNTIKEIVKEITKIASPESIYIFSLAVSKIFKP